MRTLTHSCGSPPAPDVLFAAFSHHVLATFAPLSWVLWGTDVRALTLAMFAMPSLNSTSIIPKSLISPSTLQTSILPLTPSTFHRPDTSFQQSATPSYTSLLTSQPSFWLHLSLEFWSLLNPPDEVPFPPPSPRGQLLSLGSGHFCCFVQNQVSWTLLWTHVLNVVIWSCPTTPLFPRSSTPLLLGSPNNAFDATAFSSTLDFCSTRG